MEEAWDFCLLNCFADFGLRFFCSCEFNSYMKCYWFWSANIIALDGFFCFRNDFVCVSSKAVAWTSCFSINASLSWTGRGVVASLKSDGVIWRMSTGFLFLLERDRTGSFNLPLYFSFAKLNTL